VDVFLGVPGTSVNTKVASSTYSGFGSWGSCHIGNNGNVAQPQGFAGRIDDVQVWDRALTDTEMLEGETPGEEPTEEPLALVSCEIGAVANDLLVCALTDPIDAAFCIPSNFEVTYDLVEQVILNASTTGNFDLCSLTLQNPPESDDVSVFVTYLPEDDGVTATNTVSFPSGPGDGLAQSAHRCLEADRALGIRKLPSCATPSPGAVNVITNVVDTVGSQKAAQRFDLWCSKDGGDAQRLTEECGDFGLCLRGDRDLVTDHGFNPVAALLPVGGGLTFQQGGSFIGEEVPGNLTPIDNDMVIENIYGLQVATGLAASVDFSHIPSDLVVDQ
jgi:hypothetical protein